MESNETPRMGRLTPDEQAESSAGGDGSALTISRNDTQRKSGARPAQARQPGAGAQQPSTRGPRSTQDGGTPLPKWVKGNLPAAWYPKSYSDVPLQLPDIQLAALYLSTRNRPDSLEGKLVALAVALKFKARLERCVHRCYTGHKAASQQRNMRDYYQQGWRGFFEALKKFDPGKASAESDDPIMAFADKHIKRYVVRQLIADLPKEPATDNTRKAYKEALEAYIRLAQELDAEPTEEQVAEAVAPELPERMGSILNRQKIVHDLFRVLRDDTASIALDQPDDEEGVTREVQVEGSIAPPEDTFIRKIDRQIARQIIRYAWKRACANLGNEQEARKLLVLQVLLNIRNPDASMRSGKAENDDTDLSGYYNMRKIAKFIRGATPGQQEQQREIEEWWDLLWHNLYLEQFRLKPDWNETRAMFQPPVTKGSLEAWHRAAIMLADWKLTDD